MSYLDEWEESVKAIQDEDLSASDRKRMCISTETLSVSDKKRMCISTETLEGLRFTGEP